MSTDNDITEDESVAVRLAKLVVSITVLTFVTVAVGYGGGALLTVSATLGGPNPETADGDTLRNRLYAWSDRNREFMRNNGQGNLPLKP